ncbi:hypothetical protein HZA44_03835 [Candidatus Peregrinibacteria bacterium]|nr:hypothetical protein [Candidatus Peregrinibacteria bacterium]
MPIEKVASLQEAVQPVDEVENPKKGLALRYRYLLIAFLAFPGSFSLPVGCATLAYNKLMEDGSKETDKPKSQPKNQGVGKGISTTLNINADSIGGE